LKIASTASGSSANRSASQPLDPEARSWPAAKLSRSGVTVSMSSSVSTVPVPASAVAACTSVVKPLLLATGLVMP
jgi:hypothetical protein